MELQKNRESGQIIVIMAVAIVVLLGFAALAIDVGMVYSDRRYDQSVADASAMAAAQFMIDKLNRINYTFKGVANTGNGVTNPLCNNAHLEGPLGSYSTTQLTTDATQKAIDRAVSNNFPTFTNNITNGHGVYIQCVPVDDFSQYIEVTTMVTSQTATSFAHLFFGGKLINTVTAKTRVYPRAVSGFGFNVVAYKDTCYTNFNNNVGEIQFSGGGSGEIVLNGGGTHSNACMAAAGNTKVTVTGGTNVFNLLTFVQPSGANAGVSPAPVKVSSILKPPTIVPPCGPKPANPPDLPTSGNATPNQWYNGIKMVGNNKTVTLSAGYYCIAGDIEIGGNNNAFNGNLVTLYMMEGMFKVTSTTASVNLVAASNGLLMYTDYGNTCNLNTAVTNPNTSSKCIDVVGGSSQYYTGTILAPHGFVAFGGNPNVSCLQNNSYPTQVMGWMVQINGTTMMCLSYDDSKMLTVPANMNVTQ